MKIKIITALAVIFFTLGFSVHLTRQNQSSGIVINIPDLEKLDAVLKTMATGEPHFATSQSSWKIVLDGPGKVEATTASDWEAVRQSATWANGNSTLADQIIVALKKTGVLNNSGSFQSTTNLNGVPFKIKLQTGAACGTSCQNISSSAYTGTKNFSNRFKIWRASDGLDALELLFDDVNTPNTTNGVLLTYRIGVLNSTLSDNPNLLVESYIYGASPSRRQTYSWAAPFWLSGTKAATTSDRGRVILEEMTLGLQGGGMVTGICVRIAARTVSMTTVCGTNNHYYALAYGQKTVSNFETTALSGVAINSMTTNGTICGFDVLKFGIFNGGGFIMDNLTSGTIPTGYPEPSSGGGYPGVQTLFNKLGTAPNGTGTYDDTQKATIDTGMGSSMSLHPSAETVPF
ncbi:hypothetical protein LEP1GSC050_3747 [Leptospira broomii serovar Hurstbridge str. 5399]|uniref:Uncharacterized protein n=1 Tax=Leptospira broomii serovar Hurstbridge str. 5399 TaxID=1049789 RepID=T0FCK3_9LEPT|nr:hypothetical protein [Leptospira broomii]EQA45576.1 hypothetical protein LEP1GSC050_3747 [Leptospira broomii serovar Hurstbridge str. 5399]